MKPLAVTTLAGVAEVPAEVQAFLRSPGNVLLVKGGAGAGKTTFVVESMRALAEPARAVYLTTRVSELAVLRQFPWITDAWRGRVVEASRFLGEAFQHAEPPEPHPGAEPADGPDGNGNGNGDAHAEHHSGPAGEVRMRPPPHPRHDPLVALRRFLGRELASTLTDGDVERLGGTGDGVGAGNLVVLDSLEGLAAPIGRDAAGVLAEVRAVAADDYHASVLVVLETSGPTPLDYLADGIVELAAYRHANAILRELRVEKMRGVAIENPVYLYTLSGGRFRAFGPDRGGRFSSRVPRAGRGGDHLSTGVRHLDHVLRGGYAWGDTVLVEASHDVDESLLDDLVFGPLSVALQQGHAAFLLPPLGQDARRAHHVLTRRLPGVGLEDRFRVGTFDVNEHALEPYVLPFAGRGVGASGVPDDEDPVIAWVRNVAAKDRRVVVAASWDQAEFHRSPGELEAFLGHTVSRARAEGWLFLLYRRTGPSRPTGDSLSRLARTHLRVEAFHKVPVLTVERPYLGSFGVAPGADGLDLVPFR